MFCLSLASTESRQNSNSQLGMDDKACTVYRQGGMLDS